MQITVYPSVASGVVTAPPSKSVAHRLLLGAALALGESTIEHVSYSEDICATLDCIEALGATVQRQADRVTIRGTDLQATQDPLELDCRQCGSTLRFLIPICLLLDKPVRIHGSTALLQRPLSVYEEICYRQGHRFELYDTRIDLQGRLHPGLYEIPGDISSQFVTGLLYALPLLPQSSEVRILPPVESRAYIDLTLSALRDYGIRIISIGQDRYHIPGCQKYRPHRSVVEGDWSNAAFLEALNLFGGRVQVRGLRDISKQGDKVYREAFAQISKGKANLDLTNCPDLGPILFAMAACHRGGFFTGTKRLKLKESDRCTAMAQELSKFGAELLVEDEHVWIDHVLLHAPDQPLDAHNDHRIAMALTILLTQYGGVLNGAEAVEKSFPDFFQVLRALGIRWENTTPALPAAEELEDGMDH